ncbi:MAG: helix-turn-helix domain-containing protein [Bacteriovoracia bacterium]
MVKAETREQAFALFLKGYSLRQIAQMITVSRSTVERWSIADRYVVNRRFNHERAIDKIRSELFRDRVKQYKCLGDSIYALCQESLAENRAILEGSASKKSRKFRPRDFCRFAKLFSEISDEANLASIYYRSIQLTKNEEEARSK